MSDRIFWLHDGSFCVSTSTGRRDRFGGLGNDWETYNRLKNVLAGKGFEIGADPWISKQYPSLNDSHHAGRCRDLHFACEVYPAGCKFEFYQEIVTVNSNGGRYNLDPLIFVCKLDDERREKLWELIKRRGGLRR